MNVAIRNATQTDVPWIVGQLREFSEFFESKRKLFENHEFAEFFISQMVQNHIVFLAESDGVPVGFIAGMQMPHFLNPSIRLLAETFWWVDKNYRGGRAGLMLLKAFTEWGKGNVDWITLSVEENSPVRDESLEKRGFRLQEKSFLMEVSGCQP